MTGLLALLACAGRHAPPPAEALVERGEASVSLRCAGDPACPARAEQAARALEAGDWAEAGRAAGEGEWRLARGSDQVVRGAWPVELGHPGLPEGQVLARFTLVDGALVVRRAEGALEAAAAPDRARALAALDGGEGWVLRAGAPGLAHEVGRPEPMVQGLSLSP